MFFQEKAIFQVFYVWEEVFSTNLPLSLEVSDICPIFVQFYIFCSCPNLISQYKTFFYIQENAVRLHHLIKNIICPIFGRSSWSLFEKKNHLPSKICFFQDKAIFQIFRVLEEVFSACKPLFQICFLCLKHYPIHEKPEKLLFH
jgi:hypothetical protein